MEDWWQPDGLQEQSQPCLYGSNNQTTCHVLPDDRKEPFDLEKSPAADTGLHPCGDSPHAATSHVGACGPKGLSARRLACAWREQL